MPQREQITINEPVHIMNRGVEKRTIYLCDDDYMRFLLCLKVFNQNQSVNIKEYLKYFEGKEELNIGNQSHWNIHSGYYVSIECFTLMNNHFHIKLKPLVDNGVSVFLQKVMMGYTKYFNYKYQRVGSLFQGPYKVVIPENDFHLNHLNAYIHLNSLDYTYPKWRNGVLANPEEALEKAIAYPWSDLKQHITPEYRKILIEILSRKAI